MKFSMYLNRGVFVMELQTTKLLTNIDGASQTAWIRRLMRRLILILTTLIYA